MAVVGCYGKERCEVLKEGYRSEGIDLIRHGGDVKTKRNEWTVEGFGGREEGRKGKGGREEMNRRILKGVWGA